ncbi:MAG: hypothetical protein DRJ03_00970 [Chloroflexi bacterium]|nr:MAG: hypothetical protein DRJ03_00970 [Chloroflexota bacterium]
MRAILESLKGKYYGTEIRIEDEGEQWSFKLWGGKGKPSERQINKAGYTLEQWENNAVIDNGWDSLIPIREADIIDTSHYETDQTFQLAQLLVDLVNNNAGRIHK